jgi:ribosomal protein S18 acetylase RimI-like enzyme
MSELNKVARMPIERNDLSSLLEFDLNGIFSQSPHAPPPLTQQEIETSLQRGDEIYWLVDSFQNRIGYYWVELQGDSVYLASIVVAAHARGQGLSHVVMNWIEEAARNKGYSICTLAVDPTNSRAISLYEKHGYNVTEKRTAYFGPQYPNTLRLIMSKKVS